jgi:hypothetical protein
MEGNEGLEGHNPDGPKGGEERVIRGFRRWACWGHGRLEEGCQSLPHGIAGETGEACTVLMEGNVG